MFNLLELLKESPLSNLRGRPTFRYNLAKSNGAGSSSKAVMGIAIIALIVALVAVSIPFIAPSSSSSSQVVSLQSQVNQLQQEMSSLPVVDQKPVIRFITMEWEATLPSLQDRWFPQDIIVNQGDTIQLTLEVNDTDGAHTFTIIAPTGPGGAGQLTQINMSMPGQWMYHPPGEIGPQFGIEVTGPQTNCDLMGQNVTCGSNTDLTTGTCSVSGCSIAGGCSINNGPLGPCTGSWMLKPGQNETAEIQTQVTIGPMGAPGVYRFFCSYHQYIGMIGFLIVLPNTGYSPTNSTSTG